MSSSGSWLQFGNSSNKFKSSYIRGFLDICGNILVRKGGLNMSDGDISCNGDIYVNRIRDFDGNLIVSSGGGGTVIDDTTNLTVNSLTEVKSTSRLTGNVGIGQASTSNALDISGNTNVIGNISTSGTTEILGTNASINKVLDVNYNLDINGNMRSSGDVYMRGSAVITSDASTITDTSDAILYIKDTRTDLSNNVILHAANSVFKASQTGNPSRTNSLEIDSANRRILPYVKDANGNILNEAIGGGWELGGPGPNRLDRIHARDVNISTNTLLIEDDSGNKIGMSFDAATGAVNYNVTTFEGEQFTIKGVQTQKISSGSGTIDPSLLEFTGLAFGDTFDSGATFDITTAYTFNLTTTTYTRNSPNSFDTVVGPQNLNEFLTSDNITSLLGSLETGNYAVIRVGTDHGRIADNFLAPIEDISTQSDRSDRILIAKKKTGTELEWSDWGTEGDINHNVAGNYLNFIELKNINMASGTYFVAKTSGDILYNIKDTDFLTNADLSGIVNGDLFLYVARGSGKNWTKIPVSLPASGSITTQMLSDGAIATSKIGFAAVTTDKLANNSVNTDQIIDESITAAKIQSGAISGSSFADDSISGVKISTGSIPLNRLDGSALNGKQDTLTAGDNINIVGTTISAVVNTIIPDGSIVNSKLALNSVQANNIAATSITGSKISSINDSGGAAIDYTKITDDAVITRTIANNAVTTDKIVNGAVTNDKISTVDGSKLVIASVTAGKIASGAVNISNILVNGIVTGAKLEKNAVDSYITAGANVTLTKDAGTGVVTIASSGGGGGGGITGTSISVNTINESTSASGVTIDGVLLKDNDVTAHTVSATNYAVGGTNFISASRQGNFRDLEVKDSNNSATILLTGDGGDMSLEGTLTVDTISESTDASGVTIDGVLLKDNDVTAHTVTAQNYAVGGTNFISASRQGNFRDLEVKDNNNNATILLTGEGGELTLSGSIKQWNP